MVLPMAGRRIGSDDLHTAEGLVCALCRDLSFRFTKPNMMMAQSAHHTSYIVAKTPDKRQGGKVGHVRAYSAYCSIYTLVDCSMRRLKGN